MKIFKPKFWMLRHISLFAIFLLPVSLLIQFLLLMKKFLSKQVTFPVPVFCVGNIFLGGTGKTPISIKISKILSKLKKKPAIIKKFYKNQFDEVQLIKSKVNSIFLNSSREKAINSAIKKNFDVIIMDDGFQDYTIKKDLNILCFNQNQQLGNGLTIPSGPLRENFKSIKNSNIIIINGNPLKEFEDKIEKISKEVKIFYCKYIPLNISKFRNKKLIAFAGIGNPNNFFDLLKENNLNIIEQIKFADHHHYLDLELNNLIQKSELNNAILLTTEKDYMRISEEYKEKIKYLKIKSKIQNRDKFIEEIKKYI